MRAISADRTERERLEEQHTLFASIINSSHDAILSMNLDGIITSWNHGAEKIFGYSYNEIIGKLISVLIPYHLFNEEKEIIQQIKGGQSIDHYKTERIKKNGEIIYVSLTISPVKDSLGNIIGVSKISHDITGSRKREKEISRLNQGIAIANEELETSIKKLKESEELFSKIFETSPVGISIGEIQSGIIINVNDHFLQMTGYNRNEVIGHTSLELGLIPSNERKRIKQELALAGKVKEKEITLRKKSGEKISALVSFDQFSVSDKQYAITICYNISERKKAEDARAAANRDLNAFTYSVSHDLKTPLTIISSSASVLEMLLKNKLDEEGLKFLEKIKRHSMLMGQLISDLLELSRYSQITSFSTMKVDMKKLAEEVVDELKLNYGSTPVSIRVNDISPAHANSGLIRQVWINLLSNALKYSRHKENSFIEISSQETKGGIIYSIKDNGAGFDMQEYKKLFDVFQRLHSDDEFEGTGIGLAIVQRIVFNHKGKVWAKGKKGEGAIFYFSLPNV